MAGEHALTFLHVSVCAGAHPGHPGECEPSRLGLAERYFLAVADVPRLEARLSAMSYIKGFDSTAAKVQVRVPLCFREHTQRCI